MDLTNPQVTLRQARIEELEAELAKEREKVKELAKDLSRVLETVKYLKGIAERGSGDSCPEGMAVEQFVLGYVQNLEARLKVASRRGKSVLPELAAAQAKVAKWERVFGHLGTADECGNEWIALQEQLAAAQAEKKFVDDVLETERNIYRTSMAGMQAVIEQMREALTEVVDADECQDADGWLCFELSAEAYHRADAALALPTNLDALHEAKAQECERLADKSEQGMLLCNEQIEELYWQTKNERNWKVDFARAIEAAVRAELAGQEPVAWCAGYDDPRMGRIHSDPSMCEPEVDALVSRCEGRIVKVPLFAAPVVQPDDSKDAARYRWLRDNKFTGEEGICAQIEVCMDSVLCIPAREVGCWPDAVDSAIDAVMTAEKDQK